MDLKALARKNRVQKVCFEVAGEEYRLSFIVPVFLQALNFQEDYSTVVEKTLHVATVYKDLQLAMPNREDAVDDKHYEQMQEEHIEHITSMSEDDKEQYVACLKHYNRAILEFAVKWLPKVCEDFAGLSEDEIAAVVKQAGEGVGNPLIEGLARLNGNVESPNNEELDDLPF